MRRSQSKDPTRFRMTDSFPSESVTTYRSPAFDPITFEFSEIKGRREEGLREIAAGASESYEIIARIEAFLVEVLEGNYLLHVRGDVNFDFTFFDIHNHNLAPFARFVKLQIV